MYIRLIRTVLEDAVNTYSKENDITVSDVLGKVRKHIDDTAREHRKDEPEIKYDDPLCRLGYLYRHATANATLFERVIRDSGPIRQKVSGSNEGTLTICAIGGGPGTELLGLSKYLLRNQNIVPRKISFTVLDIVPQWADTWSQLSDAVENELRRDLDEDDDYEPPTIAPMFIPLDALKADSYDTYNYQFRNADIVVLNYLFSENKASMDNAKGAISKLHDAVPAGCTFVVIDRKEHSDAFMSGVASAFKNAGFNKPEFHTYSDTLSADEQTAEMGRMLNNSLGTPRVKFFTDGYRDPTVFWFTVTK